MDISAWDVANLCERMIISRQEARAILQDCHRSFSKCLETLTSSQSSEASQNSPSVAEAKCSESFSILSGLNSLTATETRSLADLLSMLSLADRSLVISSLSVGGDA